VPDVRVIAITNEDLSARVKAGTFRSDLYFRLNVFPVELPALRDHKEDIPEIVDHLLAWQRSQKPGGAGGERSMKPTGEALEVLASYGWPGNVRELRNVLERAAIVAGDAEIDAQLVRGILESALVTPLPSETREFLLRKNLDAVEREIVLRALAHTAGRKKEASLLLGIDPRNLGYYLRKHKIGDGKGKESPEG
jgi:two-component system response regulator AtoC